MASRAPKRWHERSRDRPLEECLASALGITGLAARILINRGISTVEEGRKFLEPRLALLEPPHRLRDMDRAAERLVEAIERSENVEIWGDYDVDGTTATALLIDFLRSVGGGRTTYYIPHRQRHGYGIHTEGLREIRDRGVSLLVTVDCGVTAEAQLQEASKIGLDVIVTDHHVVRGPLPPAIAVLNPSRSDCSFPFKSLAGVGLAFYLAGGVRQRLSEGAGDRRGDLGALLDLVALGTVADVSPLVGHNRILVRAGIEQIRSNPRPGIAALLEKAGCETEAVDAEDLAFRLVPRLNAAGRMGSAKTAVDLLLSEDFREARDLAERLEAHNSERRRIQEAVTEQALAQMESHPGWRGRGAIVLASPGWHKGVVGIVAARLVDQFGVPSIVIALDGPVGTGSARSVPGLDVSRAVSMCGSLLLAYGGHAQAAGITLRAEEVDTFREAFVSEVEKAAGPRQPEPEIPFDAVVDLDAIGDDFGRDLDRLAPFGSSNDEPLLCARDVRVDESSTVGGDHARLLVAQGTSRFKAIGFRFGSNAPQAGGRADILFAPRWNFWRGSRSLELRLIDWRTPEAGVGSV